MKGLAVCSAVPQSKAQLQDYHSLHLVFTIMLYRSLVSYIAAFTMASSVAVSANPVARGGSSECDTGSVQCCDQVTSGGDPSVRSLSSLLGLVISPTAIVGLNCIGVLSATQW